MNGTYTDIPLALVGVDFRVASSRWRSQLVLDDSQAQAITRQLRASGWADGFLDLSTCNRNEWVVASGNPHWAAELLKAQMLARLDEEGRLRVEPYVKLGEEAAAHLFRVVIGQESLVHGERQISGQFHAALEQARGRGTSTRVLNGLGSIAGRLVRLALRSGRLESTATGVHSLALAYLMSALGNATGRRVAVIGLGSIGRKVLSLLQTRGGYELVSCNRTVSDNQRVRPLTDLRAVLSEVDAALFCTGACNPILTLESLPQRSPERPLILIDIGIPEQIARGTPPAGVRVAHLDELIAFHGCQDPVANQAESAATAELIDRAVAEFRAFCGERTFLALLDAVQRNHRQLVWKEIPALMAERLHELPEGLRTSLEAELRDLVLDYTNEVFKTIKETCGSATEAACPSEP